MRIHRAASLELAANKFYSKLLSLPRAKKTSCELPPYE